MATGNAFSVKFTHTVAHFLGGYYFRGAEKKIAFEWQTYIEPRIREADFRTVLDFATGYGRNSQYLLPKVSEALYLVDANRVCIEHCRRRFAAYNGPAQIHYHVNNGNDLAGINSGVITFLYSWDSMVHFDQALTAGYLHEFARVLAPGGSALIHHSNHGTGAGFWLLNPHRRSDVSREGFAEAARAAGLTVAEQDVIDWYGATKLDCISLLVKK